MDVQGFTIDGPKSRDLDDAIWVESSGRGWVVTVCIANVADAISVNSHFDESARRRVETSYFAHDRNEPMLPRRFSEVSCSLVEGERRSVMGIRIRLDHTLEPQGLPTIDATTLVSKKRLSYSEIPGILKDTSHPMRDVVSPAAALASALMKSRREQGAFVLYDLNTGWITTEDGYLRRLRDVTETMGHIIVQELMILANTQLARYCAENDIPVPYRNHTARSSAPERADLMERLDVGMSTAIPNLDIVRRQFNLVMNRAEYGSAIEGHFGLSLPAYLHCTSPIRRYADLLAQRQILAHTRGGKMPYTKGDIDILCEHINATLQIRSENHTEAAVDRANRQAEKAIRKSDLERLSKKEFERVVKVAARSEGRNSFVIEAFRDKLQSGDAAIIDMHTVLFESDWSHIKGEIIDFLIGHPGHAKAICNIAVQVNGWGEPKFKVARHGNGSGIGHTASVSYRKKKIESPDVTSRSLKTAKQVANIFALCVALELEMPKWVDEEVVEIQDKPTSIPSVDGENPIGDLGEYCQALALPLPSYACERREEGPDLKFVVSCKALDMSVKSSPQPNKKAAKKEAALRAIAMLHELQNEKTI